MSSQFTFISRVFKFLGPEELPIVVNAAKRWRVQYPTPALDREPPAPMYFSVAAHKVQKEQPRRGKRFFSSAHVFVLDDVGTKCPEPPVKPSYIIETSAGNFQYGYLLQPYPYRERYTQALKMLATAGYTDAGAIDPVHLFRLPNSLHSTGFQAQLHLADYRRRKQLSEWLREFKVDLPRDIRELPNVFKGRPTSAKEIASDEYYAWLREQGQISEPMNASGWVSIPCPFAHRHTQTDDPNWSTARYKPGSKVFCCFHEGCANRRNEEYFHELRRQMYA